jgi:hypothetical protein
MAESARAAAQSRTAKLPHTKQPNPVKSLKGAPLLSSASGSMAGAGYSRLFVALAMDWFKCDSERNREARRLTNGHRRQRCRTLGSLPHSFTVGSSLGLSNYRRRVFRHERLSLLRGIARLHDTATARAQQAKRMGRIGALLTPSKGRFSYKRDACEKSQMTQRAKFKASDEISLRGIKVRVDRNEHGVRIALGMLNVTRRDLDYMRTIRIPARICAPANFRAFGES